MEIITRSKYIDKILGFLNKGMILALTGQRRVGKSYILRNLAELIQERYPDANIVYINKEKKKYSNLRTNTDLDEYLSDKFKPSGLNFLLIDEVQDIDGFEHTLRSLNADEECQIIVTGSNAKMLSSELSTYLGGRYIDIHIQSLSYPEFLKFHKLEDSQDILEKYLIFGGMPHLYRLGLENEDMVWEYLHNIYNTIVLKDVIEREGIRNATLFENLLSFVSDNVGQIVSGSSLSKYLKSQKVDVTTSTILNYLGSAGNAYIINKVPRYDIHGKKLLESNDKYFFEDLGLRNILVGSNREKDMEKLIENAVYLHLKNLGYKVTVGVLPNAEVDFVAENNGKKIYVQATYLVASEQTQEREFGNLLKIKDNYPKYVVSMDPISLSKNYDGIQHLSLRKFLLKEDL
ncbi:MAG: ATP-binding protein [Muribaculaceae bacterium]|nr:ATP-binding protein [Muribaculaceae bacterium]MDE7369899.1 ATP-binding protein [Muribaculaceae bacterium]